MSKSRIIIIVSFIIAFLGGGGTGYWAHDCGKQEPKKVLIGLDGTVPVEVTCKCECLSDPCTVNIEQLPPLEGPCEEPPIIFEPAWNAGLSLGDHILSADFSWDIKRSRFDPYIQAVYITDYSSMASDYKWNQSMVQSSSDTKWLIGVRYHGRAKWLVSSGD